jgi:hypothetical protein
VGRRGSWAGPPGPKGSGAGFVFFLFFFKLHFQILFSTQIQIKLLQPSLKNFIDFLETTQATKKPYKPTDDAHTLVVSKFIILSLIFLELNFI